MSLTETARRLTASANSNRLDSMDALSQSVQQMGRALGSILTRIEALDRQSGDRLAAQVEPLARALADLSDETRQVLEEARSAVQKAQTDATDRLETVLEQAQNAALTADLAAQTLKAHKPEPVLRPVLMGSTIAGLIVSGLLIGFLIWRPLPAPQPVQPAAPALTAQERQWMEWGKAVERNWSRLDAKTQKTVLAP